MTGQETDLVHIDEVRVSVRFADSAIDRDTPEIWSLTTDGGTWSPAALKADVRQLAWASSEAEYPNSFLFDAKESETNWGASGSLVEIGLVLATSALSDLTQIRG